MKKIAKIAVILMAALLLASCGGPKVLGIFPAYTGATVTDTHHEFKNEDFYVLASFEDGTDEEVYDFTFTVEGMDQGYYIIRIDYKGCSNPCYVPINAAIYPSDSASGTAETDHEH